MKPPRVDYGVDAPGVVRNLILGGTLGLAVWAATLGGVWAGDVTFFGSELRLTYMAFWAGLGLLATGLRMIWSSKWGKIREARAVAQSHSVAR